MAELQRTLYSTVSHRQNLGWTIDKVDVTRTYFDVIGYCLVTTEDIFVHSISK